MRLAIGLAVLAMIAAGAPSAAAQPPTAAADDDSGFEQLGFFVDVAMARYRLRSETIDGDAGVPVVAAGVQWSPRFSLRVETTVGRLDFTRTRRARFTLNGGSDAVDAVLRQLSREEIERLWPETDLEVRRHVRSVTSILAAAHQQLGSRVRLALLAGLTLQRETSREQRVDPTLLDLSPRYEFTTHVTESSRTQGLLGLGIDVDVRLTRRLSVVPQVRFDVGEDANDPDDGITVIRPGMALRWTF